ncbi:MAG: GNAT family N-acetyltransferase [Candidatus Odinarchaeota archaeon]
MYSLRKANFNDIEKLIELRIKFLKEIQDPLNNMEMKIFKKTLRDFFLEKMKSNEFISWLAESDNIIIATSGCSFLQRPSSFLNITGKFAYIMNMYTIFAWRRKGIGSALLKKLLEEIKEKGMQVIALHTTPSGMPLYENYGFRRNDGDKEMILNLKREKK